MYAPFKRESQPNGRRFYFAATLMCVVSGIFTVFGAHMPACGIRCATQKASAAQKCSRGDDHSAAANLTT